MDAIQLKKQLIIGLLAAGSGALASLTFYSKSNEKMDPAKLVKSVGLAFGVGFIGGFWTVPEDALVASPIYGYVSIIFENLIKAVYRKFNA